MRKNLCFGGHRGQLGGAARGWSSVVARIEEHCTDLEALLQTTTAIRLVKGAYNESSEIAFARESDVDENYLRCARNMLESAQSEVIGYVPAFTTHDTVIIRNIVLMAKQMGVAHNAYEFQLPYGINTSEQRRLAHEGFRVRVLISYGSAWFA